MGWMMGIEPTTIGTTIRGSTTELHPPQPITAQTALLRWLFYTCFNGVDDGDRTHDHRSHNPGLYH